MAKYMCPTCGYIMDDDEYNDEEEMCVKCSDGPCDEVEYCKFCEEYHRIDEICGDVCDDCVDQYKYDIDLCYEIGKHIDVYPIEINPFLTETFSVADIEEILLMYLAEKEKHTAIDCSYFIKNNRERFAEVLLDLKHEHCFKTPRHNIY